VEEDEMHQEWGRRGMHQVYWWEIKKKVWRILGWNLERWDGVMWTGLVWLRIGTGGDRL
jgi:hypothetical protein